MMHAMGVHCDDFSCGRFYVRSDRWEWTVAQCSLRDVILIGEPRGASCVY